MRRHYEQKMVDYAARFDEANHKFYGLTREIIETDMGPELIWDVPVDRETATYEMLTTVFDMLYEILGQMYEYKSERTKKGS